MLPVTWRGRRRILQAAALTLLLVIPLLNFHLDWNFLQGWYQSIGIGDLWIVSPLEGIESILVSRQLFGPLLAAMLIPIIIAVTVGRVFCGWICPVHLFSDIIESLRARLSTSKYPAERWQLFRGFLLVALVAEIAVTLILGAPLFVIFSPPGLVGRELMMLVFFGTLAAEGLIVVAVLLLNLISRRFFCRYLCPLAGLLALLSSRRKVRVVSSKNGCIHCRKCKKSCPYGLYAGQGEGQLIYCSNCGECIDACPQKQLSFILK